MNKFKVQVTLDGKIAEEIVKKRKQISTWRERESIQEQFENENGRITDWAETEELEYKKGDKK